MRFTTLIAFCLLHTACLAEVGGDECDGPRCTSGGGQGSGSGSATSATCTDPEELVAPITIRSDADFEALPEGCWSLNATLRLEGPGVTSFARLGDLLEVNDLEIVDTALTSISARTPVKVWGSLLVSGNTRLTALANLAVERWDGPTADGVPFSVAYVIRNNPVLTTIDGLAYIAQVDRDLRITDNAQLGVVELPELARVTGTVQISNTGATAVRLANLATVGRLEVTSNPKLGQLGGLAATSITGDVILRANPVLTTIGTMSSLTRIGGALTIDDNDALVDLGALTTQLGQIGGALAVTGNAKLTSIGRLGRLTTGIGSSITITGNPQLSQCAAIEVDHCVTGGTAIIQNNLTQTSCNCWCGQ